MKKRFTKKELEILKTLWNSAAPMIASEIAKANNALNLNTVHACLRSLSDKGAIKVDDIVYSGTVLTRSYVPVITSEEYFGDLYNDILLGWHFHPVRGCRWHKPYDPWTFLRSCDPRSRVFLHSRAKK